MDSPSSIPQVTFHNPKLDSAELEVIDLSVLRERDIEDHNPSQAHRVSFFALLYITAGRGHHQVDFVDYSLHAGDALVIQREQVHAFSFSSSLEGKLLVFTQAFLDQVHANMRLPNYTPTHLNPSYNPLIRLEPATRKRCDNLVAELTTETALAQPDPLITMYLFSALSLMLRRQQPLVNGEQLANTRSEAFSRFMGLLQESFTQTRDANWYAQQLHTTYKTLNQVCKQATGQTAKQLIDAFTVIEIKRQLVVSQSNSQQLAYQLGFEDASNFVKYFKKHTQQTPAQFQRCFGESA